MEPLCIHKFLYSSAQAIALHIPSNNLTHCSCLSLLSWPLSSATCTPKCEDDWDRDLESGDSGSKGLPSPIEHRNHSCKREPSTGIMKEGTHRQKKIVEPNELDGKK